jgi:hypothetical protein
MTATNSTEAKQAIKGGAVAGLIGGAVITVFLTALVLIKGGDVWSNVFKGAAAPFLGAAATRPGFDAGPVMLGALIHFAISIGCGIAFGVLAYGLSKPMTLLASLAFGIVVWLGMYYVALPLAGLGDMARETPIANAIITHLVFGLAVGVGFLPFQHRKSIARRRRIDHGEPAHMPM